MRIAIIVAIACMVSFHGHCQFSEKNKKARKLYVQLGMQFGVVLNSTKTAKAYQIGWSAGLGYKIHEDLRLEVNWVGSALGTVVKHEKFPKNADRYAFEPGALFAGTSFGLKYLVNFDTRDPRKGLWYCEVGLNVLHSRYQGEDFYAIYRDSSSYITAKGKFMTSFVAPFIESGFYSRSHRIDRPLAANLGIHMGLRYTFIPTVYHGSYHSEIDRKVRDGTMIMNRGYLTIIFNYPIGKTWVSEGSREQRRNYRKALKHHGHHKKSSGKIKREKKNSNAIIPNDRKIIDH